MARRPARTLAHTILSRVEALSLFTGEAGAITRLYLTPEHRAAAEAIVCWMSEAGMAACIDAAGTVVGRLEGARPDAKTLLIGSHIDSVRNGGRFDGVLGVLVAIEAVAELRRRGKALPFAVEVLAFGDEEGVRFGRTHEGSSVIAGIAGPAALTTTDMAGTTLREALTAFGGDPEGLGGAARNATAVLGYIEVHIEQGPVLEGEGVPVGVVTAISGASRYEVEVTGTAGHAGTLPMTSRRDALTAAAQMVLAVEAIARARNGLVATVGQIHALPGAINVVPGAVELSLDIRSPVDSTRRTGVREIERELRAIARKRHVSVRMHETYNERTVTCDQRFMRHLSAAIEGRGLEVCMLPSGAGHAGVALSKLCPVGMLFVRCKGGISHNPAEAVKPDDVEVAARALIDFLEHVAPGGRSIA